jgi:hypothetical protein
MDNRFWSYGCSRDGRFLTNYTKYNVVDQFIRTTHNINSAQDYRAFLQKHGDDFLNNERGYLIKNNVCSVNGKCLPLSTKGNQNTLPCSECNSN